MTRFLGETVVRRRVLALEPLEERVLLSADPLTAVMDGAALAVLETQANPQDAGSALVQEVASEASQACAPAGTDEDAAPPAEEDGIITPSSFGFSNIVAMNLYGDGVMVVILDTDLSNGTSSVNVAWDNSEYVSGSTHIHIDPGTIGDGALEKVHFVRGGGLKDVGIMIIWSNEVKEFTDDRTGGKLAFLLVQGELTTATFHREVTGANLNGFFIPIYGGGFNDIDGDGDTSDKISVAVVGTSNLLDFRAGTGAEVFVGGNIGEIRSTGGVLKGAQIVGNITTIDCSNPGATAVNGVVKITGNIIDFIANGHVRSELDFSINAELIRVAGGRFIDINRGNATPLVSTGYHLTRVEVYGYTGPAVNVVVGDIKPSCLLYYFSIEGGDFRGALEASAIYEAFYYGPGGVKKPITTTGVNGTGSFINSLYVANGDIRSTIDTDTYSPTGEGVIGSIEVANGGLTSGGLIRSGKGIGTLEFNAKVYGTVEVMSGDFGVFIVNNADFWRGRVDVFYGSMAAVMIDGYWTDSTLVAVNIGRIDVVERIRDLNTPADFIVSSSPGSSFLIQDSTQSELITTLNNHVDFGGVDVSVV